MGDGSDGSGDWGLYPSLLSRVWVTNAVVSRMLNGLGGKLKSFWLGRMIGSCRPNPYGIVGSFELSSIVKIRGSADAIDDTEGIRAMCCSDSSVELRILGELFLCGLGSFEIYSTQKTSESLETIEILEITLIFKIEEIYPASS